MKKIAKLLASAILIAVPVAADDFDFDNLGGGDDFGFDMGSDSGSALSVSGDADLSLREMTGDWAGDNTWDNLLEGSGWDFAPELTLDLLYTTDKADFSASLNMNEEDLTEDLFNDLSVTWYEDNFTLAVGYQEVVWGKGDKVHVVDVLNPLDYTDFLNADYLDRKIAQPMVKLNVPHAMNGQIELVYVPFFEGDSYAYDGSWAAADAQALMSTLETAVGNSSLSDYAATYAYLSGLGYLPVQADAAATASMMLYALDHDSADELLPSTADLEHGQAAIRGTASFGGVDLGALYWYGYNRQPSVYYTGTVADYLNADYSLDDFAIDYDQLHVFGLEAGAVVAGFNLRGEAAYYMSEDYDGTDAEIINPSFNYVVGFDRGLPVNNMNVNIQVNGSYTMFHDEITSTFDVEAGDDETFTLIVAKLSDTFNHEKVKPEVTMVYCPEDQSGQVKPAVAMDIDGNLSFEVSGTMFWGDDDSFFGYFNENDFVEMKASFSF